jgi:hypothetical protein
VSIIEEALRRREQDRSSPAAPSGPMLPPLPSAEAPEPPAAAPRPPPLPAARRKVSPWAVLALCLLLVAFGFALVYALSVTGIRLWRGPSEAAVAEVSDSPGEDSSGPWNRVFESVAATLATAASRSAETDAAGEDSPSEPPPPKAPSEPEPAAAAATAPAVADPTPVSAPPPESGVKATWIGGLMKGVASAAPGEGPADHAAADVKWPEVTLKGILASSRPGASSALFADGAIVLAGDTHRGLRVVEVRRDEIVVEKQGTRRTMRCGQSLP